MTTRHSTLAVDADRFSDRQLEKSAALWSSVEGRHISVDELRALCAVYRSRGFTTIPSKHCNDFDEKGHCRGHLERSGIADEELARLHRLRDAILVDHPGREMQRAMIVDSLPALLDEIDLLRRERDEALVEKREVNLLIEAAHDKAAEVERLRDLCGRLAELRLDNGYLHCRWCRRFIRHQGDPPERGAGGHEEGCPVPLVPTRGGT
jgi:hypothetical protein